MNGRTTSLICKATKGENMLRHDGVFKVVGEDTDQLKQLVKFFSEYAGIKRYDSYAEYEEDGAQYLEFADTVTGVSDHKYHTLRGTRPNIPTVLGMLESKIEEGDWLDDYNLFFFERTWWGFRVCEGIDVEYDEG